MAHTTCDKDKNNNHQVNDGHEPEDQELPQILVLEAPPIVRYYDDQFLKNFRLLRAWESPLPLDQFLTIHALNPSPPLFWKISAHHQHPPVARSPRYNLWLPPALALITLTCRSAKGVASP